jgi:hypothetical protein
MPRKGEPLPHAQPKPVPPVGVKISTDLETSLLRHPRPVPRWTDPISKRRIIRSEIVDDEAAAHEFFDSLRQSSAKGHGTCPMTLTEFVTTIGDRWGARPSTPPPPGETYGYGPQAPGATCPRAPAGPRRSPPGSSTAPSMPGRNGTGASTIKNSIAPLVRVLDEAVRDGLIPINPAKNRAKRSLNRNAFRLQPAEDASPRAHAIPDMATLTTLAEACGNIHQSLLRLRHARRPSSQRAHPRSRAFRAGGRPGSTRTS